MVEVVIKKLSRKLSIMSRWKKQTLLFGSDFAMLVTSMWVAYSLRFGYAFEPNQSQWILMVSAPLLALPVFIKMGLYRSVIRYLGEQVLWSIVKGMSLAALLWTGVVFLTEMRGLEGVPRSVPVLYWLIGICVISSSRFAARWFLWVPLRVRFKGRQVLLYGAGEAGRQLASSLRKGHKFFPAGFLDDDRTIQGKDIDGLRVYAPEELPSLISRFDIGDVIICISSASGGRRREIARILENQGVKVQVLPAITDIVDGAHLVSLIREIDVGDLLGREAISAQPGLMRQCLAEKVVMVTGAGGSIGSELCKQIAPIGPSRIVLLESNEEALYQVDRQLKALTDTEVVSKLGSVQNEKLISQLVSGQGVQTIYHAAAYKHVPLVEENVIEAIKNNLLGTLSVVKAAYNSSVENFVLISTDKAVRPKNVMGITKRLAERIVSDYSHLAFQSESGQKFCSVRFGNVLGSSGSVVPLFKEQIAQGGPVTVTHDRVTRYFMSVHEAVELVIQAGSLASGGEVFHLDMGEPVKIVDLAKNMIRLSGYSCRDEANPEGDIEIVITGLRPGEKLHEELLVDGQQLQGTVHPLIMKSSSGRRDIQETEKLISAIDEALREQDEEYIRSILLSYYDI